MKIYISPAILEFEHYDLIRVYYLDKWQVPILPYPFSSTNYTWPVEICSKSQNELLFPHNWAPEDRVLRPSYPN